MKSFLETAAAGVAGRPASDWLLSGIGISAAAISASFAIAMVAIGPGAVQVSGNFPLFAAWDARTRAPTAVVAVSSPGPTEVAPRTTRAEPAEPGIDFTPTGSIASHAPLSGQKPAAAPRTAPIARRLDGFVLRDVFDGKALVEARNRLRIVEPGSILQDAGRVLAIRRDGPHWVVETETGMIGGPPGEPPLPAGTNPD